MKAAQLVNYGGENSVVVSKDAVKPIAGSGQVLVRVHASGINPFDITVREGRARKMKELNLPATLGGDVAGVVAEIGDDVNGFHIGQEVYGQADALSGQGSFAEYTPVKASQLAAKPVKTDWVQAASLPLAGCSAYQALVDHISLQKGQKILIHGGGGGIGSIATQLAKHLGAYVATTVSDTDMEFAKNLGADEIIDYKAQDFSRIITNYDAVFDTIGGDINRKSYGVIKPGGHLVSMVEQPDNDLAEKHKINYTAQFTRVTTERLVKLADLVDKGKIEPQVAKIFPLDQAAQALEYVKTEHARGKIVIKVR